MKYYIIAGERSGDMHASHLMKEIKKLDNMSEFRYLGGDYMQAQGGVLVRHYKEMALMGFLEVLLNIDKVWRNLTTCRKDILEYSPDALILVDYSGFNLRIAAYIKKARPDIKILYYISPKIWAWNTSRANKIKKLIDQMYVILPFEKEFYKQFDYDVHYVGNPSLDEVNEFKPDNDFRKNNSIGSKPIIAVLPGSRRSEVDHMLHFMVSILPAFRNHEFVVAAVTNLDPNYYKAFEREGVVTIVYDKTYDLLSVADAAIVTSGTATLETALFNVPQIVCFATSPITYLIAKTLIKVKFISLVNLIAGKKVVNELIQNNFTPPTLMEELIKLTNDATLRAEIKLEYQKIKKILGNENAAVNTARLITEFLNK